MPSKSISQSKQKNNNQRPKPKVNFEIIVSTGKSEDDMPISEDDTPIIEEIITKKRKKENETSPVITSEKSYQSKYDSAYHEWKNKGINRSSESTFLREYYNGLVQEEEKDFFIKKFPIDTTWIKFINKCKFTKKELDEVEKIEKEYEELNGTKTRKQDTIQPHYSYHKIYFSENLLSPDRKKLFAEHFPEYAKLFVFEEQSNFSEKQKTKLNKYYQNSKIFSPGDIVNAMYRRDFKLSKEPANELAKIGFENQHIITESNIINGPRASRPVTRFKEEQGNAGSDFFKGKPSKSKEQQPSQKTQKKESKLNKLRNNRYG